MRFSNSAHGTTSRRVVPARLSVIFKTEFRSAVDVYLVTANNSHALNTLARFRADGRRLRWAQVRPEAVVYQRQPAQATTAR
jgi:hypothetical protein